MMNQELPKLLAMDIVVEWLPRNWVGSVAR